MQTNIPAIPGKANKKIICGREDTPRKDIDPGDWEKSQGVPMIQKQDNAEIDFSNL